MFIFEVYKNVASLGKVANWIGNMWRGVVPLIFILAGVSLADVQYGEGAVKSVQRLKRTPYYDYNPDCPPDYYNHHHHPHPPFWPPPPPGGPPPPPPYWPPPPPPRQEVIYVQQQRDEKSQEYRQPENKEPCATCQSAGSNAVSNAQSETGQAIAVAIAKAKSK